MKAQFDFIIIGAGSSGCVLANRLSANPDARVLLVEAGGADRSPFIHMPAGINRVKDNPKTDWIYRTSPQPSLGGRTIAVPRGKVLGGSSAINAMVYIRGQRQDYDDWRDMGNASWGYEDVLPYFIKSEGNSGVGLEAGYHGTDGPLGVMDRVYTHPLSDAFVDSGIAAGLPENKDFNGTSQEGVGRYQVTQRDSKRCSAAVAYLRPVMSRPNLTVATGAHVLEIMTAGNRAIGVRYRQKGKTHTAEAANEVILSAGAINSPQLLLLSGVGPAGELAAHGIKVAADLPGVGKNLQDHLNLSVLAKTHDPISLAGIASGFKAMRALGQFLYNRTGPGTTNGAESGGFYASPLSPGRPDIQLHLVPLMLGDGMQDVGIHGVTVHACNLRPTDRGELTLASNDPMAAPIIDNRFLGTDGNIQVMREGLAIAREILASGPMAKLISDEYLPGKDVTAISAIDQFIRSNSETEYHPSGTCKMGSDDMAVFDADLRVRGFDNLRVVDASVMPSLISGNKNAPCMMIAEKAADMILT
jgi:choline dehydrogenase